MADSADMRFMLRALELATNGRGLTYPNPLVGALLVKRGRVIAEGYHRKVGGDHAELVALKAARSSAKGATLFVTLEPCCHTGRTGPCTDAIIKAGISTVVVATLDPDIRVNGRGVKQLRKAGINVRIGVCKREALELNEAYHHHQRTGLPFVILKLAQSLDGRIATRSGDSKWISGKQSRTYVHRLRSEVGAVVVGGETARKDNPELTVRLVKGLDPHRIVVSRSLNLPSDLKLLTNNSDKKTIVASSESAIDSFIAKPHHPDLIYWSVREDRSSGLDLGDLITKAGKFGFRSLLVEGGSRLATSFIKQNLVDKVVCVIAPKLIGDGLNTIGQLGIQEIKDAIQFDRAGFFASGEDLIFVGYPKGKR